MSNGFFVVPMPQNEPVRDYEPGSAERASLIETLTQMSVFAGIPAMTRALELAKDVLGDKEGNKT